MRCPQNSRFPIEAVHALPCLSVWAGRSPPSGRDIPVFVTGSVCDPHPVSFQPIASHLTAPFPPPYPLSYHPGP